MLCTDEFVRNLTRNEGNEGQNEIAAKEECLLTNGMADSTRNMTEINGAWTLFQPYR